MTCSPPPGSAVQHFHGVILAITSFTMPMVIQPVGLLHVVVRA